jgi:hypothetical protein
MLFRIADSGISSYPSLLINAAFSRGENPCIWLKTCRLSGGAFFSLMLSIPGFDPCQCGSICKGGSIVST